jgi:hypothetical protein
MSSTGNQLRDSLFHWLSPPDPSTNHNIASKAHHHGTAQWFFQGSIFDEWKSTNNILWIHGKGVLPFSFTTSSFLIIFQFHSWIGEECSLVCSSSACSAL